MAVTQAAGNLVSRLGAQAALRALWWPAARLGAVTGPIFQKELRVASRRRRSYVLRFVYVGLLTLFVALAWARAVSITSHASAAYRVSRMADAGKIITATVVFFQFLMAQLLALILLSAAISEEVYQRTLGVLMSTPIHSFQIVMGKLLSRLWQLIILLAISLPVLAVVRVFGGVPWEFVVSALCITLSSALLVGSVSLFFSITTRRAYAAILRAFLVLFVLFGFLPWLAGWMLILRGSVPPQTFLAGLFYLNPFVAMNSLTGRMFMAGAAPAAWWPGNCLIMLAGSAIVLAISVARVRKVALGQAVGEEPPFARRRRRRPELAAAAPKSGHAPAARGVREVRGSPVLWKELRTPLFRTRARNVVGAVIVLAGLLVTYAVIAREHALDEDITHIVLPLIYLGTGILTTAVLSATSITSEKEARTWPLLLGTTLSDWHIFLGKAGGIFRRCLPVWMLLFGHLVVFSLVGYVHPIAIPQMLILVGWVVMFFTASGLYFSARFRRTTSAVVMNLVLGLALWVILPGLMAMAIPLLLDPFAGSLGFLKFYGIVADINPFVQGTVIMAATGGARNAHHSLAGPGYRWPWPTEEMDAGTSNAILLAMLALYGLVGVVLSLRAKARFRRQIF